MDTRMFTLAVTRRFGRRASRRASDLADHHRLVHGLDHVVDRQRRDRDRRQRLHLDAGPFGRAHSGLDRVTVPHRRSASRRRATGRADDRAGSGRAVCFAAMMPASRAVCSGSPFLIAPARISRSASRDIVISPRATASRDVTALSDTSTIRTWPCGPTWDSAGPFLEAGPCLEARALVEAFLMTFLKARGAPLLSMRLGPHAQALPLARRAHGGSGLSLPMHEATAEGAYSSASPCARKNDRTLERHGQVDALQFDVGRHLQPAGRKVEHRLDSCRYDGIDDGLRGLGGNGDDRDGDLLAPHDRAELANVVDGDAAARACPILSCIESKSAAISKPSSRNPG